MPSNDFLAALLDILVVCIVLSVFVYLIVGVSAPLDQGPRIPVECSLGCDILSELRIRTQNGVQCVYHEGYLESVRVLQESTFVETCTVFTSGDDVQFEKHF